MTSFDFSPLFNTAIGFDRLAKLLEAATSGREAASSYPPYNIEKLDEDRYRITMAVAGFSERNIDVTVRDNLLVVTGTADAADEGKEYLHRGIAGRSFERRFALADYVQVTDASLADGLLHIDLVREVPDAQKPRRIEIAVPGEGPDRPTIEGKAA